MSGKKKKDTRSVQVNAQPAMQSPGPASSPSLPKWAPFALIAVTAIIYSRALQGSITFMDDDYYILKNPYIRDLSWHGIVSIFTSFYNYNYHPFTTLTWLLVYSLFKLNPLPYHLVNVLLHLVNVWLVFRLALRLSSRDTAAFVVAALFALHPMHVESVAWISETKDVLYTAFYLLACLAYLQYIGNGGKAKHYMLMTAFFIASLFSKPAAVTLPLLLVVIDIYKGRSINAKTLLEKTPLLVISLIFAALTVMSQRAGGALHDLSADYSITNRIFLFTSGLSIYLLKLVAPIGQSAIYYFPNTTAGLLPWPYYASMPFLIAVVCLTAWLIRKSHIKKDAIFGICFFLVTISVMLQIVTVGSALIADRYTYVSYIGLFYVVGQWVSDLLMTPKKNLIIGTGICIIAAFSVQTWARIDVWKDTDTLFTDIEQKNPGNLHNSFLYNSWGDYRYSQDDAPGALQYYNEAIRLYPAYERALYGRGLTYDKLGNPLSAISDYNEAIRLNPNSARYYNSRGWSLFEKGDMKAALTDFNSAISLDPKYAEAFNNRGWLYYKSGDNGEAMNDFNKAISLGAEFSKPLYNRAAIKAGTGDLKGAIEDYNTILQNHPDDSLAYFNRGVMHLNSRDTGGACADWKKAAELGNVNAKQLAHELCH